MTLYEELQKLAIAHPPLAEEKSDNMVDRLQRMSYFYSSKIEDTEIAPKQASYFKGLVSSLAYAITVIQLHRKLGRRLNELLEAHKDD